MSKTARNKPSRTLLVLSAFVVVIFVLESLFLGDLIKVEGVKIGLYNCFIVLAVIKIKPAYGYSLFIVKLTAGLLLFSSALLYPIIGGLFSVTGMIGVKKYLKDKIGWLGVSVTGAVIYNITIYTAAMVSLSNRAVLYNIPAVLLLSVLLGALTGGLAYLLSKSNVFCRIIGGKNENE